MVDVAAPDGAASPSRCSQVYMLMELQPAKEITGGPWYGPDAFDKGEGLRPCSTAAAAAAVAGTALFPLRRRGLMAREISGGR